MLYLLLPYIGEETIKFSKNSSEKLKLLKE
jgi:hypothetical protein